MGIPAPLTTEDWARVRYEYESTDRTIFDICAERGISDGTLRDRVRRWGWKRRRSGPVPREGPPPMVVPIIEINGLAAQNGAQGGGDDAGDDTCDDTCEDVEELRASLKPADRRPDRAGTARAAAAVSGRLGGICGAGGETCRGEADFSETKIKSQNRQVGTPTESAIADSAGFLCGHEAVTKTVREPVTSR